MSPISSNQATNANKKAYHTPQLRNLGKVSDLTFANPGAGGLDSGTFNSYTS